MEAEAEGESGFGKGMFGVGEIVFCEVAAQQQNTFQEFHDSQTYLFINPISYDLLIDLFNFMNSLVIPVVVLL